MDAVKREQKAKNAPGPRPSDAHQQHQTAQKQTPQLRDCCYQRLLSMQHKLHIKFNTLDQRIMSLEDQMKPTADGRWRWRTSGGSGKGYEVVHRNINRSDSMLPQPLIQVVSRAAASTTSHREKLRGNRRRGASRSAAVPANLRECAAGKHAAPPRGRVYAQLNAAACYLGEADG